MKKAISFIFMLAVVTAASSAFAQSEKLTEGEYNAVLAKALDAASAKDRRVSTEETFYDGPRVTGTRRIVSDFAGPDAKKIAVSEEFNGKKTRSDAVRIGDRIFCRDGDNGWKKSARDCSKINMMAIPDGEYAYSVEQDANDASRKIYVRRATFEDAGSPEREAARLKFIEINFVTDDTGAITEYRETRRGGIEPNGWSSTQVTKYEYEPAGLKISDPTKAN